MVTRLQENHGGPDKTGYHCARTLYLSPNYCKEREKLDIWGREQYIGACTSSRSFLSRLVCSHTHSLCLSLSVSLSHSLSLSISLSLTHTLIVYKDYSILYDNPAIETRKHSSLVHRCKKLITEKYR